MAERSCPSWRVPHVLGRGVAGFLVFVTGCAPGNTPPSPTPESSGLGFTYDCFIPANQRAALPEKLASDLEARCEPPAIPRKGGGAVNTPIPTIPAGFDRDPRVRLATPTPQIPPEADRLREALESSRSGRFNYKDFSEKKEMVITVAFEGENNFRIDAEIKRIGDRGQPEITSGSYIVIGGRSWKKEGDKSWEESEGQTFPDSLFLGGYLEHMLGLIKNRRVATRSDPARNLIIFSASYPGSSSPYKDLIPGVATKEQLTLTVNSRTYLPVALRVEDFAGNGKLFRELIANFDYNASVAIRPPGS